MFKSLKAPYQHSGMTQHYLGIENQSAKKLAMITRSHHICSHVRLFTGLRRHV
jgi:hypothetical protein